MSKVISERERFADKVYVLIQLFSKSMMLLGGLVGLLASDFTGFAVGATLGFLLGKCMAYSLGKRGNDPFAGYYIRMRERASGSRAGLLERFIESIRGRSFPREKCRGIADAYDVSMERLKTTEDTVARRLIFEALSETTKEISYGETPIR